MERESRQIGNAQQTEHLLQHIIAHLVRAVVRQFHGNDLFANSALHLLVVLPLQELRISTPASTHFLLVVTNLLLQNRNDVVGVGGLGGSVFNPQDALRTHAHSAHIRRTNPRNRSCRY